MANKIMTTLRNIFLCNGFEPDVIRPLRHQLVNETIDGLKKLAMGLGSIYVLAIFIDVNHAYTVVDIGYLAIFTIFLLMVNLFKHNKNYRLAEGASVFFVIATLGLAIYEGTFMTLNSRCAFFPIYMILIATMFTGNPMAIDCISLIMTTICLILSYKLKTNEYFYQDFFTNIFALLTSNMVNAVTARAKISKIIKTDEVTRNREKYKTVYDNLPCGVCQFHVKNGEIRFDEVNALALEMLGYDEQGFWQKKSWRLEDMLVSEDTDGMGQKIAQLKCKGDHIDYEARFTKKDGTYSWVGGTMQVTDARDGWVCVLCIGSYTGERKAAEERIHTLVKQYEMLYNTTPCGILEYRITGSGQKMLNINQFGLQLFDSTKEELMALDSIDIIKRTHPEDREQIIKCLASLHNVGDRQDYEYRFMLNDGTYAWLVGQIYVTGVSADGVTVLSACINIDAEKKALDASRAKTEFLSRMSHDIRTPMNAIIGLTDIVLDDPGLARQTRENMLAIKSSSKFLLGLINDILDVSKIEANEMELHPEPYLKDEFVNYLNTMIRPLCEQKGIDFEINTEGTAYEYVMLDKVRFNQIFFNLLSNAVKFTPAGGRIYVCIDHLSIENGFVNERIVISDTGIGMSEDFQKHMFDPFTQENAEHVDERQGSGLGLAIVKRVVDLMNGKMEVNSAPGRGTTYTITMMLEICEGTAGQSDEADFSILRGRRVLLCEDHPINRKIAVTLLNKENITAETACDGAEGLAMYVGKDAGYYDAILMDIRMPNMNGMEAARMIRSSGRADAHRIPIIAMTANVFDTDRKASLDAGMNEHIPKPIDAALLYRTLSGCIADSQSV